MFDWFKKNKDASNVVNFPAPKTVPPMPEVEKPAIVYYRIGTTDKNRISFQMGYGEITMNKEGVENLIKQLEVFKEQLQDESDD